MHVRYSLLASQATTALFVLLWGSAAIFTRWGLDNASPMALLVFRFLIAWSRWRRWPSSVGAGYPRRAPACRQRPPA